MIALKRKAGEDEACVANKKVCGGVGVRLGKAWQKWAITICTRERGLDEIKASSPWNVFTDGSFDKESLSAGYGVYFPSAEESHKGTGMAVQVPQENGWCKNGNPIVDSLIVSSLNMELLAIHDSIAAVQLYKARGYWQSNKLNIYTDSLQSLKLLQFAQCRPEHPDCIQLKPLLQCIVGAASKSGMEIRLCKVKAHDKVYENNVADGLARRGRQLEGRKIQWFHAERSAKSTSDCEIVKYSEIKV